MMRPRGNSRSSWPPRSTSSPRNDLGLDRDPQTAERDLARVRVVGHVARLLVGEHEQGHAVVARAERVSHAGAGRPADDAAGANVVLLVAEEDHAATLEHDEQLLLV